MTVSLNSNDDRPTDARAGQPDLLGQEILDSVAAVKAVFASAKGPSVAQLRQKVNQIEAYIRRIETPTIPDQDECSLEVTLKLQRECITAIAQQFQQAKGRAALLEVAVTALREALNVDRVLIYRLEEDNRGRAIAEAVGADWTSLLNQCLPLPLFGVESGTGNGILPDLFELTTQQQQFWKRFEVQTSLSLNLTAAGRPRAAAPPLQGGVPMTLQQQPWGLLVIHSCLKPRQWQETERSLLQQVAMALTIALQKTELAACPAQAILPAPALSPSESINRPQLLAPFLQASQTVQGVAQLADYAIDRLNTVEDTFAATERQLQHLVKSCQKAARLTNLMDSFSTQVLVLSLNTAIEATKSNNQDRGLVAIAEQVEALAKQARENVADIKEWVQELHTATTAVAAAVEPGHQQVSIGVDLITKIREQLGVIAQIVAGAFRMTLTAGTTNSALQTLTADRTEIATLCQELTDSDCSNFQHQQSVNVIYSENIKG